MVLSRLTGCWLPLQRYLTSANWWIRFTSIGLLACIASGTLLGRFYFFELFSHFQMQYWYLLAGLILLIAGRNQDRYYKLKQTGFVVPSLVLLWISPSTDGFQWLPGSYARPLFPARGDVRIYHANVLIDRSEYKTTVASLRRERPDLYVLQEMTPASIRLVTGQLRTEFPHWFACWSKKTCWTLVGSRTPVRTDRALAKARQIIAVTTQVRGRTMSLITVHPRVPLLPSWFRQRNAQLAEVTRRTRYNPLPTVLIGDFNISVFSPIYTDLFRPPLNKVSTGRSGLLESGRRRLTQPTWPDFLPAFLMIPIDHAFVNNGFSFDQFRPFSQSGSDHRAVVADLRFSDAPPPQVRHR